ncbi:MAG: hypothetical protein R2850_06255 [Bacteroidia bacterium]
MIRYILSVLLTNLFFLFPAKAQMHRDQDLVTLKNGYQLLGYVVEQHPGKLIKVYRPEENDTSEVALSDISKLTKIWVQPFSPKKIEQKDTLIPGRFNNKRHVFSISYIMQWRDIEGRQRKGLELSWHRNFNNRFLGGFGATVFGKQNPLPQYSGFDSNNSDFTLNQYYLFLSGQIRPGKKVQNKRLSTLFNINLGFVIEQSESHYNSSGDIYSLKYEKPKGGIVLHAGYAFRINPDNQSGIIVEPGYTLLPQNVSQYSGEPDNAGAIYLGSRRQVNHLFNLRISYFF